MSAGGGRRAPGDLALPGDRPTYRRGLTAWPAPLAAARPGCLRPGCLAWARLGPGAVVAAGVGSVLLADRHPGLAWRRPARVCPTRRSGTRRHLHTSAATWPGVRVASQRQPGFFEAAPDAISSVMTASRLLPGTTRPVRSPRRDFRALPFRLAGRVGFRGDGRCGHGWLLRRRRTAVYLRADPPRSSLASVSAGQRHILQELWATRGHSLRSAPGTECPARWFRAGLSAQDWTVLPSHRRQECG